MPMAPESCNLAGVTPRSITVAARVALLVAVTVIFWLATTERVFPELELFSDKLRHSAAFLVLAVLADRAFPRPGLLAAKAASLLAFGAGIEIVQYFLPYREASLLDLLADGVGIALHAVVRPFLSTLPVFRPPTDG